MINILYSGGSGNANIRFLKGFLKPHLLLGRPQSPGNISYYNQIPEENILRGLANEVLSIAR